MRILKIALAMLAGVFLATAPAQASIVVRVDKTTQTMRVTVGGEQRYVWSVSTGRMGYNTPNGTYRPQRLERMWHSRKYGMAPMPHSIFFRGGYAIHGTGDVGRLGRTASHGCIRLAPGNARTLFELVRANRGATRIVIEGSPRHEAPAMVSRRGQTRVAAAPSQTRQMRRAAPSQARALAPVRPAITRPVSAGTQVVPVRPATPHVYPAPMQGGEFFNWYLRR